MKQTKNKGGRPLKEIDQKTFEGMCGIQATRDEMCAVFDCDDNTLNSWCKRTYKKSFSAIYKTKKGTGKISLRRTLWQHGQTSVPACIFLAKNHLGMSDAPVEHDDGSPLAKLAEAIQELKDSAKQ